MSEEKITLQELLPNEFYINKEDIMVAEISLKQINQIADILTNYYKENERLNNIINELEDYICVIEYDERNYNETWQIVVRIHNKLKELKDSDIE